MDSSALLLALAAALVAVGLAGTLLPALPGVPLVFAGLVLAAWAEGFEQVGLGSVAVIAVLATIAWGLDFAAGLLGARHFGASRSALVGAGLGAVVGLFFGLPGFLLGPFAGAALGELIARRDLLQAGRAGFGAWLGLLFGSVAKLALCLSMLLVFLAARIW